MIEERILPPSIILPPVTFPVINSLAPPSAPVGSDHLSLTVSGANFAPGSQVFVHPLGSGAAPTAVPTTFVSSGTLQATLPRAVLQAPVILEVTVQGGNLNSSSPFNLSVSYPNIGTVSPTSVQANAPATLTIQAVDIYVFADGSRKSGVQIDGTMLGTSQVAVAIDPSQPDRGTITVQVPATLLGPGQRAVRLVNPTDAGPVLGGQAAITATTITTMRPAITALSPSSGPVGIDVTISGRNLAGATAVRFGNGQLADFSVASGTITAEVPDAATSGPVTVVTSAGSAASPVSFGVTVATNPPKVTDLQPRQGSVGDRVKIIGKSFVDVTAVRFGVIPNVSRGVKALAFTVVSPTEIDAVVPDGAVTGLVRVKTRTQGKGDSSFPFAVVPKLGTLNAFGPLIGVLGDSVELVGQGLGRAVAVNFGGIGAPFLINSDQSITAYVPIKNTLSDQTVRIDVVVPDGSFGKDGFIVQKTPVNGIFQITGFDPDRAAPFGTVNVFGALENPADVEFGGVPGQITFFRPDGLGFTAQVPQNAIDGPISVRQNFGELAESVGDFIANGPSGLPADGQPAIDSFTPRLGAPGSPVTIHGVNLAGNVAQVQFGGIPTVFGFNGQDLHVTVPGTVSGPAYITIMPSTNGVPVTSARPFIVI